MCLSFPLLRSKKVVFAPSRYVCMQLCYWKDVTIVLINEIIALLARQIIFFF